MGFKVKGLFVKNDILSQVIVSDKNLVSINALEIVFLLQPTCYVCSTLQGMSTQNAKSSWIRLKNGKILWMLKNYCYRLRINNCIINYWKTLQIDAHIIKHLFTMSKIRGWRLLRRSLYKHGLIGWCIMETQQQIGTLIIWHCFFFLHFILLN